MTKDLNSIKILDGRSGALTSADLLTTDTFYVKTGETGGSVYPLSIDMDIDFTMPHYVHFIKDDRDDKGVLISFKQRNLDGRKVNYYHTYEYELELPDEGVTFMFYESTIKITDRMGLEAFGVEKMSSVPLYGAFPLDGTQTIPDGVTRWHRTGWISSGQSGVQEKHPFFFQGTGRTLINLTGTFPRYREGHLDIEEESLPNITGTTYAEVNDASLYSGAFHRDVAVNEVGAANDGSETEMISFDASRVHEAYGRRDEVAPKNYATKVYIYL